MFSKIFLHEDQLWNKQQEFESRIIAYTPEVMMMEWHFFHAGYVIPMHDHYHTQISYVVKGTVKTILTDGTEKICTAGEAVSFAPNEAHSVIVLEQDTVVMDVFNPIRLDHLEKHYKVEVKVETEDPDMKTLEEMSEMLNPEPFAAMYGEGEQSWWSDALAAAYSKLLGGQRAIFDVLIESDLPEGQGFNETDMDAWNEVLPMPLKPETFAALRMFEREKRMKNKAEQ